MFRTRLAYTLLGLAVTGAWIVAGTGDAATWNGLGGNGNWSTGGNWVGGVAPNPGDLLQFGGNTNLSTSSDTAADTSYSGIDFNSGAGSFTLGGNSVLLGGDINQNSANNQSITLGLTLDGATSNIGGSGAGTLSLGQLNFGLAAQSLNVSTLNLNRTVSSTGLNVRTNSASPNTINVASGTYNISGPAVANNAIVVVGTNPTAAANVPTLLNVTGAGNVNVQTTNGNFVVGVGSGNNTFGRNQTTLDMSGMAGNFTYNTGTTGTGNFYIGFGTRPEATVRFGSGANSITAASLVIGDSNQTPGFPLPPNNNNNGGISRLFLGSSTNVINAGTITLGNTKAWADIDWQVPGSGSVTIAGQAGGTSRANITVGRFSSGSATTNSSRILLAGHTANVLAETVQIGVLNGATGSAPANLITFDTGTFDLNSLQIGVNQNTASNTNGAAGEFRIGGDSPNPAATGVLTVNNSFFLGNDTSAVLTSPTKPTFTINGGTANINTNIQVVTNGDTSIDVHTLNLNAGTLNMTGHNIGNPGAQVLTLNLTDGNLTNAARIAGKAINLGATVNITGTPTYVLPDTGTLTSSLASLNLVNGGGIEGGGATGATVTGNVVAQTGSHITVGNNATASTLTFGNDLSLSNGSTVSVDLSDNPSSGNDVLNVSGNLTAAGTVNVDIGALGAGATVGNTYTLMNYSGALTGNQTNFSVGAGGSRKTFTVLPTASTLNTIQVSVGGSGPLALTWVGNVNNQWNLNGDANWTSGGPQKFFNQDNVTFNDTSTNASAVQLVGNLLPTSVTVDGTRNYTFAGSGSIAGGALLTKQGTGTLTVTNANSYTGGTQINDGVVEIGNGGSLGTGSVANATTLRINRTDASNFANVVSGAGNVSYTGTGTTTVSGVSTYTGATTISAGTVSATNSGSMGDPTGGAVTISSGAALDVGGNSAANGTNFGAKQFMIAGTGVGGTGVLTNSNATVAQQNAFQQVTLSADATVGGPGRFDIRGGTPTLNLQSHTLTKTGANQFTLVGVTVDDGNIVVNQGTFSMETSTFVADNLSGTKFTYNDGTTLQFFNKAAGGISRPMEFNGSVTVRNASGNTTSTFESPVTMKGSATYTWATATAATDVNQNGIISESGGPRGIEVKTSNAFNVLTLGADNTFTGSVALSGPGTLNISPLSTTPYLGNTANVSVDTNSILGLNFAGTDTIGALLIGGVSQVAGEYGAIGSGAANERSQLTGGGRLLVTAKILPGDFNGDNKVDAADFVMWRNNEGTFTILANDPLSGTKIDGDQYAIWRSNFGNSSPGSGSGVGVNGAVPEPSAIVLTLLAMAGRAMPEKPWSSLRSASS